MAGYHSRTLALKALDPRFRFRCRYRLGDAALKGSVGRRGMLQPVMVAPSAAGTFELIAGHQRVQAAHELGFEEVPALELEGKLSDEDLFLAALLSNWNQMLTDLDRAWAVCRSKELFHFKEAVILQEILPAVGWPSGRHCFEESLAVAKLDRSLLDLIAEGRMPFRGARRLAAFREDDQRAFAKFVAAEIFLTSSQLMHVAEWLGDLLQQSDLSLETYLKRFGLDRNLQAGPRDRRQKGELFYGELRGLRFPAVADREKKFDALSHAVRDDGMNLKLEPSAFFEGEGFLLHARMRKAEALDRLMEWIKEKRGALNSLFDIML